MYVVIYRDSDGDVYLNKFDTLEEAQAGVATNEPNETITLSQFGNGEQLNIEEDGTLAIVFKATDLIVETQRVTLREPVVLQ